MKLAISLAGLLVLCLCSASLAAYPVSTDNTVDLDEIMALKDVKVIGVNNPTPQTGGEDVGTAVAIPALPYSDGGNTCAFANDYDEVCPFTGSLSPDAVYAYTPSSSGAIDISLCDSGYDTKLFVYENVAGNLVGCNDDACGSDGFRSELVGLPVTAGNTYYIVVDGYASDCGEYIMNVSENTPCIVDCPAGSVAEGEVDCFPDYNDNYNGGCNSTPNVFTNIDCGSPSVTVCGTYGGFLFTGLSYRDTDWYALDVDANLGNVVVNVSGVYETLSGYLNAANGCGAPAFEEFLITGPCDTATFNLPAGAYWLFVGTASFGDAAGACGGAYTITLDGYDCPVVSVEPASWTEIKANYR